MAWGPQETQLFNVFKHTDEDKSKGRSYEKIFWRKHLLVHFSITTPWDKRQAQLHLGRPGPTHDTFTAVLAHTISGQHRSKREGGEDHTACGNADSWLEFKKLAWTRALQLARVASEETRSIPIVWAQAFAGAAGGRAWQVACDPEQRRRVEVVEWRETTTLRLRQGQMSDSAARRRSHRWSARLAASSWQSQFAPIKQQPGCWSQNTYSH